MKKVSTKLKDKYEQAIDNLVEGVIDGIMSANQCGKVEISEQTLKQVIVGFQQEANGLGV